MEMSSSMTGMGTSTLPAAAAATSAMNMDMEGSSTGMDMVFFSAINTPLFSNNWTPSTTGQYAGTCIFLIILTVIFRGLLVARSYLDSTAWANGSVDGQSLLATYRERSENDSDGKVEAARAHSIQAKHQPWQLRIDGWRAVLETVVVGVGYLLMLAVMTMNVGYFASILAGTLLGTVALGRFTRGGPVC